MDISKQTEQKEGKWKELYEEKIGEFEELKAEYDDFMGIN